MKALLDPFKINQTLLLNQSSLITNTGLNF